jgi:hypothetical protein
VHSSVPCATVTEPAGHVEHDVELLGEN